jgi:polyhydroxybutyrate depolymerase
MSKSLLALMFGFVLTTAHAQEPGKKPEAFGVGDHTRKLTVEGRERVYLVHVPKKYDPKTPTPVVLALHGAGMNGAAMVWFTGLNKKSDEAGFIVVYPSGTGTGPFLTWNSGGFAAKDKPNDVLFVTQLLDDLGGLVNVDTKRVYVCGMSNGGMMAYRLAAELSERIAAIAPVAGTIAIEDSKPKRPVPVMHIHGSKDTIVPYTIPAGKLVKFKGVEESVQTWVKLNGCGEEPTVETISKDGDEMKVTRTTYAKGKADSEVVLVVVEGGGHTWPGQAPPIGFIGKSTLTVSANDIIWDFFQKHKLK